MRRWVLVAFFICTPALCFAAVTSSKVTGSLGGKPAILATSTVREMPPQAALDSDYTLSLQANPYLSGTAVNLRDPLQLSAVLLGSTPAEEKLWYQTAPQVVNGRWNTIVFPAIPRGLYRLELRAGALLSTSTLSVGLPSQPLIDTDPSLPTYDVADGKLLHFKITAHGAGEIGLVQLTFDVEPTNASVDSLALYAFTDSDYSTTSEIGGDGVSLAQGSLDLNNHFVAVLQEPLVIPVGSTYYFELQGAVSPSDANYQVATALVGDNGSVSVDTEEAVASSSNFVWSPDLRGEASTTNPDWTNSVVALGLLARGPSTVRTSTPGAPVCTLDLSTSTIQKGGSVTATWQSSGASAATWEDNSPASLQGSKTFTNVQATHTYSLTFTGQAGVAPVYCFANVGVGTAAAVTTAATTTTIADSFVASSTTNSLKVGFGGSVNNSKSCTSATWSFGYGDKATSTISVGANTCKAVNFYFYHTYSKAGTYLAILTKGTGTSTTQVVQRKVIVVPTAAAYSNAASVIGAISDTAYSIFRQVVDFIRHSVPRL